MWDFFCINLWFFTSLKQIAKNPPKIKKLLKNMLKKQKERPKKD